MRNRLTYAADGARKRPEGAAEGAPTEKPPGAADGALNEKREAGVCTLVCDAAEVCTATGGVCTTTDGAVGGAGLAEGTGECACAMAATVECAPS